MIRDSLSFIVELSSSLLVHFSLFIHFSPFVHSVFTCSLFHIVSLFAPRNVNEALIAAHPCALLQRIPTPGILSWLWVSCARLAPVPQIGSQCVVV